MRLTTKSEYSLLALLFIARNGDDGFVKIEDICNQYCIPKKYLEHLMTVLRQNLILKTKRGSDGGYKLNVLPKEISIARIIRLMDGALAPTEAVSEYFFSETPLSKEKKTLKVLKDIRDYISDKLENLTLVDLL